MERVRRRTGSPLPPLPLYEQIKVHVVDRISDGTFKPGDKIPSENEFAAELGASRLTVHRALRELTTSGVLQRVHGVGTYVAQPKAASTFIRLHNIADDIRLRGQALSIQVHRLSRVTAGIEIAGAMEVGPRQPLFHSLLVYCADGMPVQIEDRYVLPAFAPAYLDQDFTDRSTTDYLQAITPPTQAEHEMQAILPSVAEAELLGIATSDPCLLITRKTWVNDGVTTWTRFLHAGGRHRFLSRATLGGQDS